MRPDSDFCVFDESLHHFDLGNSLPLDEKTARGLRLLDSVRGGPENAPVKGPLLPPPLLPGDLVALAAPSGAVRKGAFLRGAEFVAGLGYHVTYREDIFARQGYLAGDDRRRADELNAWLADGQVRAVLLARGGYGSSRLVGLLDFRPLRRHPKIVAGYSDATALLLHLHRTTGLAVFNGPFVSDSQRALSSLFETLGEGARPVTIGGLRPLRHGRARGPVTGGNLSLLAHSIGTPFEVQTDGAILFVEEVNEHPYRIDRMLRQLAMAGKFRRLSGLLLGSFTGCGRGGAARAGELLLEAAGERNIPVAAGFPAGHGRSNATFPLGVEALLDTGARSLTFGAHLGERKR